MPKQQRIPALISVDECLEYAAECEDCADQTGDAEARERLIEIARTWRELAQQITDARTLH